jgi:hypothetical protein
MQKKCQKNRQFEAGSEIIFYISGDGNTLTTVIDGLWPILRLFMGFFGIFVCFMGVFSIFCVFYGIFGYFWVFL